MADEDTKDGTETQLALSARNVNIRYRLFEDNQASIRHLFLTRGRSKEKRVIHAVKDVSFDIRRGESVGLIGSNGSGKSSLLRAVGGLMPVDSGEILAATRPTLLGVGAVLRPELTGRLNIQIGLLAKGLPRAETAELEPQVIEFADLEEFIDLPMKTYSSGMRARLHFAIATIDQPELLMIDEALSVGDKDFREKSKDRLEALVDNAGCLILVSHQLGEITRMCQRAIWLEKGELRADGPADEVVKFYSESS